MFKTQSYFPSQIPKQCYAATFTAVCDKWQLSLTKCCLPWLILKNTTHLRGIMEIFGCEMRPLECLPHIPSNNPVIEGQLSTHIQANFSSFQHKLSGDFPGHIPQETTEISTVLLGNIQFTDAYICVNLHFYNLTFIIQRYYILRWSLTYITATR